ncbi:uncharacterized protein E5676_scaffold369G00220 [Cucumis melo var. makuwa]|uniref:Integrase zinc-binding domain-containing protein n=1 Tax=Cucumis melo var. makuwa TaxID=1194695 RepID=A0A5D3BIQ4_CUCMM|nr:uncharacterized protein E5676_scaffold369G00220 [Cucumis melo var. makuwa]
MAWVHRKRDTGRCVRHSRVSMGDRQTRVALAPAIWHTLGKPETPLEISRSYDDGRLARQRARRDLTRAIECAPSSFRYAQMSLEASMSVRNHTMSVRMLAEEGHTSLVEQVIEGPDAQNQCKRMPKSPRLSRNSFEDMGQTFQKGVEGACIHGNHPKGICESYSPSTSSHPTMLGTPNIKVPKLNVYSGLRNATTVENILFGLERYFVVLGVCDDEARINNAPIFLRDAEQLWWHRKYINQSQNAIHSWKQFKTELQRNFVPQNAEMDTRAKLRRLRHIGSILNYTLDDAIAKTETLVDYSTQSKGKKPGPNKHEDKYDKAKSFGHKYEGKAKTFQWRHGKMMVYTKTDDNNSPKEREASKDVVTIARSTKNEGYAATDTMPTELPKKLSPRMEVDTSKANVVADDLSCKVELSTITASMPTSNFLKKFEEGVKHDALAKNLLKLAKEGKTRCFCENNGTLLTVDNRLFVSRWGSLWKDILKECHNSLWAGHPSMNSTLALIHDKYCWPRMQDDIEAYVKTCLICQQDKGEQPLPTRLLEPLPVAEKP